MMDGLWGHSPEVTGTNAEYGNIFGITPIELMVEVTERGMLPNLSYQGTQIFQLGSEIVTEGIDTVHLSLPKF